MIITLQTLIFFRESLITVIERFLRPYYKKLSLKFKGDDNSDDEESDEHVFAEYDDEKGVAFYPPVYLQRYAGVSDCLMDERWCGNLEKVVEFGYHDMSFIKYLKDVPGIKHILGVDIETIPLRCSSDFLGSNNYVSSQKCPLQVTLFNGNAADPDYRLIGCDAVVSIEMIEHMLPHDLERFIHTVFGFIKPQIAIFTTPNGDFNILFKALEKNGLRRLDHLFEWSREQFHDWCSNIVARYPEYTVTCKGIGPGPTGTSHLGCCSQLALFVAKEYQKQPDLNLNSLALAAKASNPSDLSDMIDSWECPDTMVENKMLCKPNSVESFTELLFDQQSCMTIVIASPTFSLKSLESMEYKDKMLQCNLETELGKNFLMFDDDMCFKVLIPSRKKIFRVYEIEDVVNRLNCSTFQVRRFSKNTQNLMAMNKMESFAHSREVVNEIRHLAKMLNFKEQSASRESQSTWCNINWGANPPYRNQYYKIVREYSYPFEIITDDCRILDLITEEINRQIDTEEFAVDMHKLEIPIDHLMRAVEHITTDVEQVKELLEWNGYVIADDAVIHSRQLVDNISADARGEDWQDDTVSDWDTMDVRSTSLSDGSTSVPECYGHSFRRALDQKLRKLRTLFTVDEDVTNELDRVVCQLMKLALRASKETENPPPYSWMQCKLLDLLTLTENSIERRRLRQLVDITKSLRAIEYHKENDNINDINLNKMNIDPIVKQILSEYEHCVSSGDKLDTNSDLQRYDDSESDYISVKSIEFEELEETYELNNIELVPDPRYGSESLISSNDSISNGNDYKQPEYSQTGSVLKYRADFGVKNKTFSKKRNMYKRKNKHNIQKVEKRTKILKKVFSRRSSYFNIVKYNSIEYEEYKISEPENPKENQKLRSAAPRPIPGSLIKLCASYSNFIKSTKELNPVISDSNKNALYNDISATEDCVYIGIVTEDGEETVAMRRNIGTIPETNLGITMDNNFNYKQNADMENVNSQTIFLYDLNEPSTSKGIRQLCTDVQCGTDETITLSATTSVPKIRKPSGIKIGESDTNVHENKNTYDFGTSTEFDKILSVCTKSVQIKNITCNVGCINDNVESLSINQKETNDLPHSSEISDLYTEAKTGQPVSNILKIEGSVSGICGDANLPSTIITSTKRKKDFQIQSVSDARGVVANISQTSFNRPRLVCGGIHVHSFIERQVVEDVVYQGEWQQIQNFSKRNAAVPKKKKINLKQHAGVNEIKRFAKTKTAPGTNLKLSIKKHEPVNTKTQNKQLNAIDTVKTSVKSAVKVASKITVSSHISKNMKTIYTTKKHTCINKIDSPKKKEESRQKRNIKNYIPLYLRKKIQLSLLKKEHQSEIKQESENIHTENTILPRSVAQKIEDLVKIPEKALFSKIKYMVYRDEVVTKKDSGNLRIAPLTIGIIKNDDMNRSPSPQSQHSSTCSSPNSVATVRAVSARNRVICNRKNSTSSENSSSGLLDCKNKCTKIKNNSRRVKCIKKIPILSSNLCDNKENVPESSQNIISSKKDIDKITKRPILGRTTSVFMAQVPTETSSLPLSSVNISNTLSKSPKLTDVNSTEDPLDPSSSSVIQKVSLEGHSVLDCFKDKHNKDNFFTNIPDNKVFIHETFKEQQLNSSSDSDAAHISNEVNYDLSNSQLSIHNMNSRIITAIKELIENKLNIPVNSSYDSNNSDSDTVILSKEDIYVNNCNSLSPASVNTVVTNNDFSESESHTDYSLIHSYESANENYIASNTIDAKSLDTEFDLCSLKSFASVSTSKMSEYYLADSEHQTILPQDNTLDLSLVQDLFERKEQNALPNVSGALAIQAFSGFSINEPGTGDQPTFVEFVDSEIESIALESSRQVASEEIFVSVGSSDTYESCSFDDDAYVPAWLFNIISPSDESEAEEINIHLPMPIVEPGFDMNGDGMEAGIGVGAGAGDGRGMHSDHSQDSSGRGTSLSSSSETSSEQRSEAVLTGPSAFTAPVNNSHDSVNVSATIAIAGRSAALHVPIVEGICGADSSMPQSRNARSSLRPEQAASDIDADVSSLDTDAVESDN